MNMSTQELCSDACTFILIQKKKYCASYECKDCGTHDVIWRESPKDYVHQEYYKKITPVKEIPDEYEGF